MSRDEGDQREKPASTITGEDPGRKAIIVPEWEVNCDFNLGIDGVHGEPLDTVVGGSRPSHHPAELEEDVGGHGVDPHHEGGEGVEGEVADEDASRGASHQLAAV